MKKHFLLILFLLLATVVEANPVKQMLERFQKGLSNRFKIEIRSSSDQGDYFELYGGGRKVTVRANNYVSAAFGINWYLKYYCHAHVSFCEDRLPDLPVDLPQVKERHETVLSDNFYMNYCTFSYTTAFWDWKRWEREIDLMALSGINMPMAMVGAEVVWRNTLLKFGYTLPEVKEFLCGPAYFGWLLMGNLENIGGPLPDEWFKEAVHAATSDNLVDWYPVLDEKNELKKLARPRKGHFDCQMTECGPPAIRTKKGIVLLYNGKNAGKERDTDYPVGAYCAGQLLFDNNDPYKVLDRLDKPFFVPEASFEKSGQYKDGTVFIEGLAYYKKKLYLYYGCADSRIAVAVCDNVRNLKVR